MSEYEIVLDYLFENNLIQSKYDANDFISVMSEQWIDAIINESMEYLIERRRRKAEGGRVVPRERTPLYNEPSTRYDQLSPSVRNRGAVARNKDTGRLEIRRQTDAPEYHKLLPGTMNPRAAIGRAKQGMMNPDIEKMIKSGKAQYGHNVEMPRRARSSGGPNVFIEPSTPRGARHPHGGESLGMGEVGRLRGVRKQRGAKPSSGDTPVSRFRRYKAGIKDLNARAKGPMSRLDRQALEDTISIAKSRNPLSVARSRAARRKAGR